MKVKKLFKIRKGKKANQEVDDYEEDAIRYIQIEDLRNDDNIKYCIADEDVILANENDIIIAWDGANAATSNYSLKGAIGSTLGRLRPKRDDFYLPFVGLFIKSKQRFLRDNCTGATIPHVDRKVLQSLDVPLPDYEVQRKIADIIEKTDDLRQKRRQTIDKLDELTQSVFLDMFGDPVINPKKWNKKILKKLVKEFRYGTSQKSTDSGLPVLGIPNILDGSVDLSSLNRIELEDKKIKKLRLQAGDVLFVRTNGNPNHIGRCWAFDLEDSFVYASYLIRAKLKMKLLNPEFLVSLLQTQSGRTLIKSKAKTSAGQYNINNKGLGSLGIILPPMEKQLSFVKKQQEIKSFKETLKNSNKKLEILFNSLLQKAFKGELNFSDTEEQLFAAGEAQEYSA